MVFVGHRLLFHRASHTSLHLWPCKDKIQLLEFLLGNVEEVPLAILDSIVDIEAQFLEVGDDYQTGIGMLALVIESLRFDF